MSAQKYKITNNKPKKSNGNKIIIVILVVLVLVGIGVYLCYKNNQKNNNTKDGAQTSSAKTDIMEQDENTPVDPPNPNKPTGTVSDTTSDQVPTSTTATVQITSFNQADGRIKASAETSGDSGGKCVFSFTTPDDKPVVKEATSVNNKCEVSIPEVEFSKIGTWNLNVTYYVNDKKIEVNKNVTVN